MNVQSCLDAQRPSLHHVTKRPLPVMNEPPHVMRQLFPETPGLFVSSSRRQQLHFVLQISRLASLLREMWLSVRTLAIGLRPRTSPWEKMGELRPTSASLLAKSSAMPVPCALPAIAAPGGYLWAVQWHSLPADAAFY